MAYDSFIILWKVFAEVKLFDCLNDVRSRYIFFQLGCSLKLYFAVEIETDFMYFVIVEVR